MKVKRSDIKTLLVTEHIATITIVVASRDVKELVDQYNAGVKEFTLQPTLEKMASLPEPASDTGSKKGKKA